MWGSSTRLPRERVFAVGIEDVSERYGELVKSPEIRSQALAGVIEIARRLGATHVQFEWEYVDPDWRDEFAHFYATVYRDIPDRCERVHFVRDEPFEYLGFVVMRPLLGAPVSRTMLKPPDDIAHAVSARATIPAHPWGRDHKVVAFPYLSQDRQLGRCAHADVWMIALYHHYGHRSRRVYMSDVAEAAKGAAGVGRPIPSAGLSLTQVSTVFGEIGLPAVHYKLDQLPEDERMTTIVCRYLNSGFPVLLFTERPDAPLGHVTVLIGYGKTKAGEYFFVRHDDERGPYRIVEPYSVPVEGAERWFDGETGAWTQVLAPMPGKIYMTGEEAERLVRTIVIPQLINDHPELSYLGEGLTASPKRLRLRTYVVESWKYKHTAGSRGFGKDRLRELLVRGMPRWVWVTEVQSIEQAGSQNCVVAEFAIDATANPKTAGVLYGSVPGLQLELDSLGETIVYDTLASDTIDYFKTGAAVHC
jgi:hypothetical protein